MKIAFCSDLHLEFETLSIKNTENPDVLILAGDICVADHFEKLSGPRYIAANEYYKFFEQVCLEFAHVIYVMGNHEHYEGDFVDTKELLEQSLPFDNLHILNNESIKIDDVVFIGSTLWTDLNGSDPITEYHLANMMNDYRKIYNSEKNRLLRPHDTFEEHRRSVKYIQNVVDNNKDKKIVVITHHAPSRLSTPDRFKDDYRMNGGYSSNLDFMIEDFDNVAYWIHGHIHDPVDYMIGKTRIISNPRGYAGYEYTADDFVLKYIDV